MTELNTKSKLEAAHKSEPSGGPLVPYSGEKPAAPDWFIRAIETPYETGETDVQGTAITWQRWGDASKPGLLFVHGNGAHAHWWDFVAPYFMEDFHCVAFSFSGMGESGWRETYTQNMFAEEIVAVAEDTGMFSHDVKPILAAHSFGGFIARLALEKHGAKFRHAVIIDSYIPLPGEEIIGPPPRTNRNRIYDDLPTALGRFRLAPPQPCENHYILDYIARWSLKKEEGGYTWRFDPTIWTGIREDVDHAENLRQIDCPLSFMNGEQSILFPPKVFAYIKEVLGDQVPMVSIPHAQHHVWLDQPIAFISALRAILASVAVHE